MNGGCDLIETLWNVKTGITQQVEDMMRDLIETLWNVKMDGGERFWVFNLDLIETLWNVKVASTQISISGHSGSKPNVFT